MDKINIWIGQTEKSLKDFNKYFDLSNDLCDFCKDIGEEWYDEDLIGVYFNSKCNNLNAAIEETPDSSLYTEIKNICLSKDITTANAMFYYSDELEIDKDKKYNSLIYIGQFDW